jgi:hypothetical protein
MYSATNTQPRTASHPSKAQVITGRILTVIAGLFLLADSVGKLLKPPAVVQGTLQLGYQESQIVGIGVLLLVCTALYLIPRTAIFGAIMVTAYLGGAVASMVRAGAAPISLAFPVIVACVVWAGIYLRDERLHELVPIRSK